MTYESQKALTLYGATGLVASWLHSWWLPFFIVSLGFLIWTPECYQSTSGDVK